MKYIRHIFCAMLTLSLSALSCYSTITSNKYLVNSIESLNIVNNVETTQVNKEITVVDENTSNTFIESPEDDLTGDDHLEVFRFDDKILYLTENDIYLMSQIVYAESKGEPYEGKVAVASVILNRVLSPKFPDTIENVIFQPNAFSCVINGQISVVPSEDCFNAVYEAINGNDPTGEALFFYNPDIATCTWMRGIEKSNPTPIGQHVFFSL